MLQGPSPHVLERSGQASSLSHLLFFNSYTQGNYSSLQDCKIWIHGSMYEHTHGWAYPLYVNAIIANKLM